MPFITVSQGGPEIDAGVYPVVLKSIEQKTITPLSGPNAGSEVDIFDWTFEVAQGAGAFSGTELQATTSTRSGPRSKLYAYLTALLGGRAPAVGAQFEITDLIGKVALATISRSESGWPRVENLGAFPTGMAPQQLVPAPAVLPPVNAPAVVNEAPPAMVAGGPEQPPF